MRLNLDETSICLFQGSGRGNVFVAKKRRVIQFVTKRKRRAFFTHVAVICDRSDLQPCMPQVLVSNERSFPAGAMDRLRRSCPVNVVLIRQKSAWNNNILCARIIRRIAAALGHLRDRYQPVLLLDASRVHCSRAVLSACNACKFWVVIVPPPLTGLLQPLDTHAFRRFKHWLLSEFQRVRCETEQLDLPIEDFLPCVYSAIRHVLQGVAWAAAFDENGFGANQTLVSGAIRRRLSGAGCQCAAFACPTDADIALCFPGRTVIPYDLLHAQFHSAQSEAARCGSVLASGSNHDLPRGAPLGVRSAWVLSAVPVRTPTRDGPLTRSQCRITR